MANSLNAESLSNQSDPNPSGPAGSLSMAVLIASNCLPILGVILWGWEVGAIVTLYWAENLILGVITLLKMLFVGGFKAFGSMAFLTLHYGMFCAAHGTLIVDIFDLAPGYAASAANNSLVNLLAGPIDVVFNGSTGLWWWAFGALCVSHGVSYFLNFIGQREYERLTLNKLMSAPYSRILILHVTVLLGGLAVAALGSPVYLLIILVVVKISADTLLHRREHKLISKQALRSNEPGVG